MSSILKINHQVKTFSFNKKETSEDPRRREQAHKNVPCTTKMKPQVKTFSFTENKHPRRALDLEDQTFKWRIDHFKLKKMEIE